MGNLIRVFVLLFGVLIYSQDTLSVKDGAYGYDQEFKLDVNLKTESNIKALQFDLNFDENNFTYASTYSLYKERLGSDSDHTITVKKVSDSKIRVLIYSPSNKPFDNGDGKLVDFDFKNSLNFGDYSFRITNVVASLVDNSSANLILVNGTIRTKAPGFWKQYSEVNFGSIYKGSTESRTLDLQNSGNSDLTITLLKNELSKFTLKDSSGNDVEWPIVLTSKEDSDNGIGNWSYSLVFGFEADANGTYEEVISFTTDEPLSKDTVHEFKVKATVFNENKLVVQKNVESYNDQETKVKVSINGDEPITSFQFDISSDYNQINQNISYIDSSAKLLNSSTDHVISSKTLTDSEGNEFLRVVCYSNTNAIFNQPIGEIVEFSLITTGLRAGLRSLKISNSILTNSGLVNVTSSTENGTIYTYSPGLDFRPSAIYDLGEVKRNNNEKHSFSIYNSGNTTLTISDLISSDPNLMILNSLPLEIEQNSEKIIEFNLLATTLANKYSSYILPVHNANWVSFDTLKISADLVSRNTLKLTDAVYANATTKNVPLELLNSDKVNGLQFDLTFPKESKSISYTLTADGSSNYVFAEKDNANDPDLVVYVGDKINFINNAGSTHPLFIVTNNESGYDKSNELSSGVTNQGADSGTLTLDVSNLLPGTYYYICGNHKSMTGKITVLPKFSLTIDNTDLISDRATGFNVSQSLLEARKYRVLLYSDTNSTFTGNIGNIINIPITVSDITDSSMQISDGTYPILIDNIVISGNDNTNITSITQTSSKAVFTSVNLFSPVVESNQSTSINENPTADIFFYTVLATDSDDNSFVNDFKIASGNDSGTFGITSNTGELFVKAPADIDYESVQSYDLGVTASDGTKTSAIGKVTVSVIDDPNVFVTEDLTVAIYRDNTDSGIITDNYNNLNNNKSSSRSLKSNDAQKVIYSVDSGVDKE
ncbi:cadherin domain-containing protein, partial [Flavobacteriaceae bacterium]|nr:cadherin domain-containing protein [Flavobacteriaceae bacterium]